MRHFIQILVFLFTCIATSSGQNNLATHIISDSVVQKMKIKKVTENWFTNPGEAKPANTTYEQFDEKGNRILRVHINYFYHKFIHKYSYDYKRGIIADNQEYYDWNPYREKNRDDTILKKSVTKFYISTKQNIKTKPGGLNRFATTLSHDSSGNVFQQTDSIKFGYKTIYFVYGANGLLCERKCFISRHSEKPQLVSIDSLFYIPNSLSLSKEISYYGIEKDEHQFKYNRAVQTTYKYNDAGLIIEKAILEKYL